ncbi:MAG: hypothetical protein PUF51_06110 [Bifidobacteriaceae bacterium]|nr:hypothetical protein [Bifidobacteriaceae bacterium]
MLPGAFGGKVAREKIDGFKAAHGTVLYFYDNAVICAQWASARNHRALACNACADKRPGLAPGFLVTVGVAGCWCASEGHCWAVRCWECWAFSATVGLAGRRCASEGHCWAGGVQIGWGVGPLRTFFDDFDSKIVDYYLKAVPLLRKSKQRYGLRTGAG